MSAHTAGWKPRAASWATPRITRNFDFGDTNQNPYMETSDAGEVSTADPGMRVSACMRSRMDLCYQP